MVNVDTRGRSISATKCRQVTGGIAADVRATQRENLRALGRALERLGLLEQDAESAWLELEPADDTDAMPHLLGSSMSYRIAFSTP